MCRLDYKIFDSVINRTVKCFCHIINGNAISSLYMINDDMACKASSDGIIFTEFFIKLILDCTDRQTTAVVKACTKTYNKQLVVTNFILITNIIQ